jgi:predicted nucleotide-binding protein
MPNEKSRIANNRIEHDEVWRADAPHLAAHAGRWANMETARVQKVFISHGHNEVVMLKLRNFVKERLGFDPVILAEQPDEGLTVIEKLEKHGTGCVFALIVLTTDDETASGGSRARQNVIHELGFFHGLLGRDKVLLLKQTSVELFSNISGLIYKEFEADRVDAIFEEVRSALEAGSAQQGGEPVREADGKVKIDWDKIAKSHAAEMIERACSKIDAIGGIEPQEKSRRLLLRWFQSQIEDSTAAIESLGSTIAENKAEGGLGGALANVPHSAHLGDQKTRKAALEAALQELEANEATADWPGTLSSVKETMRVLVD